MCTFCNAFISSALHITDLIFYHGGRDGFDNLISSGTRGREAREHREEGREAREHREEGEEQKGWTLDQLQ